VRNKHVLTVEHVYTTVTWTFFLIVNNILGYNFN